MLIAQNIFFYFFALVIVIASLFVVSSKNIVRAALSLAVAMLGLSGIFILLASEFVAWVQVMVYIGGVMVLILFGIMMTKATIGDSKGSYGKTWLSALPALALLIVLVFKICDLFPKEKLFDISSKANQNAMLSSGSIKTLSNKIFSDYVIPLEALGVLLLIIVIGATIVAKNEKKAAK